MPNWKEAFEQVLAKGGNYDDDSLCRFCRTKGDGDCPRICPLSCLTSTGNNYSCTDIFIHGMDNSERRAICRHVLATVQDFTDRDEIRARIAEMLDDPEKFLGKPEARYCGMEPESYYGAIIGPPHRYFPPSTNADIWPDLHYIITERRGAHIAAFRDKETQDRVLAFLNGETK